MEKRIAEARRRAAEELALAQAASKGPTTKLTWRRRVLCIRWRRVGEFLALMMAIAFVALAFTFKAEHDSCARQDPVRQSSNARRLTVNKIVEMVEAEKLGTEKQRIDLAAKTARIPKLRKLDCGLPWPDTN